MLSDKDCPTCGAALPSDGGPCNYCGRGVEPRSPATEPTQPHRQRFGRRGRGYLVVGLILMAALYVLGWVFEDFEYWLDPKAVAVWTGALPFAAFVWTAGWDPRWGSVWLGLGIAVVLFVLHLGICGLARGMVQDDHVGIAALVAGIFLVGWFGGRGLHRALETSRARGWRMEDGG